MDLFARQTDLVRNSRRLLRWYAVIAVALAASLGLTAVALVAYASWSRPTFHPGAAAYAVAFSGGAGVALLALLVTTALEWRRLRRGSAALARVLGGTLVDPSDPRPAERRLMHVVEEMALAAELPVPRVYVLAAEPGINACALAWRPRDAALCVTLGCLYRLSRAELQAVVAHGFSDLAHGDPALRLRVVALIGGLQNTSRLGRRLILPDSTTAGGGGMVPLVALIYPVAAVLGLNLLVSGALGYLGGALLGAAVVRQRVLLGDAAATQFTRDPAALASALAKVGGFVMGSRLLAQGLRSFRHVFVCSSAPPLLAPFDTHPALAARIRALDPAWDGRFLPSRIDAWLADP